MTRIFLSMVFAGILSSPVLASSMVEIPAGSFIMGENSGSDQMLTLEAFFIAKYEVTN